MSATVERGVQEAEAAPDVATLCEAFQGTAAANPDAIALRNEDGSIELTWSEYSARVKTIAAGLAALGVKRGDTVGLMMSNRPEFHLCDTAAIHLGAAPFSFYNTSPPEQIAYLLENSDCDVVIAEAQFLERIVAARGDRDRPSHIVSVESGEHEGADHSLEQLEAAGESDFDFEASWRAIESGDVLTLIYTSGTTGPPKGVELTHANMIAECHAVNAHLPIRPGARTTSYLPSAHIADRWASHYCQMMYGMEITTISDPRQLPVVLPQVKPTIWGAVPRVVEKLKAALEAGIAAEPDEERRAGIEKAIEVGLQKTRLEQAGEPVPEELAAAHAKLDEVVLSQLRAKIGLDQVEWMVVGAAPMSQEVHEFLLALGLPVLEIYGMSEASCIATICSPDEARVGTVGHSLDGGEAKLASDGELLLRGPTVMRGYRGEPEKTSEAVDSDGWLHTGDIAEIDDDGHVRIVDRKKELIINAAGKNMSPANIENAIKAASPLIGQVAVIGDRRPYNVALLVLDPDAARQYAQKVGLGEIPLEQIAADPTVQAEVDGAIQRANEKLARVEQIKRYELLAEEWLPGGDELTPTMKLKRKPIDHKYEALIEQLYAG